MARVLLCPSDYAVIVDKQIAISMEKRSADVEILIKSASNIMLAVILHGAPWLRTSAAHVNGENLRLRTAQLLFNVFRRLLVLPGLLRMGIGLAGAVLEPDCDVDGHQPVLVFDNQIRLVQITANFYCRFDKGGESRRQSFNDEVLDLIVPPNSFILRMMTHPQDMP
jgi:hypothetical protein